MKLINNFLFENIIPSFFSVFGITYRIANKISVRFLNIPKSE